jgi:hypothetical protein
MDREDSVALSKELRTDSSAQYRWHLLNAM